MVTLRGASRMHGQGAAVAFPYRQTGALSLHNHLHWGYQSAGFATRTCSCQENKPGQKRAAEGRHIHHSGKCTHATRDVCSQQACKVSQCSIWVYIPVHSYQDINRRPLIQVALQVESSMRACQALVGLICNQACLEAFDVAVLRTHTAAQHCRCFDSYVIGSGTIACHARESSTERGALTVQLALSLRARSTQNSHLKDVRYLLSRCADEAEDALRVLSV